MMNGTKEATMSKTYYIFKSEPCGCWIHTDGQGAAVLECVVLRAHHSAEELSELGRAAKWADAESLKPASLEMTAGGNHWRMFRAEAA
jgi:hypothetical protein